MVTPPWRIGMSTGCCAERPIAAVVDELASIPVLGIEVGTPPRHFNLWSPAQVGALHAQLRRAGITPIAIHAPFGGALDLSDPNPHHRNAGIGAILAAAGVLKQLGGSLVVAHPSDIVRATAPDRDQRLRSSADSLRHLHAGCLDLGMTLAVESPLPHLIGGEPGEFEWLLEQIGPDARVCLDTGHTWLGGHWDRFLAIADRRLAHLHVHDNRGQFDDHLPPGEGRIDWLKVADGLRRVNYTGWLMLELQCPGTEALAAYFSRAAAALRERLGE
jgi:sugar phosphate isomerase/epimerase